MIKYARMLFAVYISFAQAYENGGATPGVKATLSFFGFARATFTPHPKTGRAGAKGNALTLPFAFAAVFFVKFLAEIKHVIA